MPELPDIALYVEHLDRRVRGKRLESVAVRGLNVLRSVEPPLEAATGRRVTGVRRMGKRIVLDLEGDLHLVLHLMIAGRLRWRPRDARLPARIGLAAFTFTPGTLLLTEAATRQRASLHVLAGEPAVRALDPGGVEVLDAPFDTFRDALCRDDHTLKRALTDPRIVSGIGNAYSDEILHRARLSPFRRTRDLDDDAMRRLHESACATLLEWTARLRQEAGEEFPEHVTAFREGMAVHGRYGRPCPACGAPVQRIVYADNETNYCATCQTGGRLLADRALSRLLRQDWPRTLEELEELRRR
jgi:formamidopyrimidine-DNA glycosylase